MSPAGAWGSDALFSNHEGNCPKNRLSSYREDSVESHLAEIIDIKNHMYSGMHIAFRHREFSMHRQAIISDQVVKNFRGGDLSEESRSYH
jgi:predicted nucleic-acid-binding Zn-ribbon protein